MVHPEPLWPEFAYLTTKPGFFSGQLVFSSVRRIMLVRPVTKAGQTACSIDGEVAYLFTTDRSRSLTTE